MITRKLHAHRGMRRIKTSSTPGPLTERRGLLQLHLLATEKENLQKKRLWLRSQLEHTECRLNEIAQTMQAIEQRMDPPERPRTATPQLTRPTLRKTHLTY